MEQSKPQKLFSSLKKIKNSSLNNQIFSATLIVVMLTVGVKIASFIKDLVVAWRFGTRDELDAFLIALVVPSLLSNVVASSFNSALIPTYIQLRETRGISAANKLFSNLMVCVLIILSLLSILMLGFAHLYLPLLAAGFDEQKLALTFRILCIISPIILLDGIICNWRAVLNAEENFTVAGVAPIFTPIVTIILLIQVHSWGVYTLAVGLCAGMILEILAIGLTLSRKGIPLIPKWQGWDDNLTHIFKQYLLVLSGAVLLCSAVPIDQAMAAMLSPGSVASLNYGNKVIAAPMGLFTSGLTASIIPYCSKMYANGDWIKIRQTFRQNLGLIVLIGISLTILTILFSEPIVQFIFQRGSFVEKDTKIVSQIQSLYSLQIPFYIGNLFLIRLASSIKQNHLLLWVSGLDLIINIILNYIFINMIGIKGIALSTSIVYVFSFFFLFLKINKYTSQEANNLNAANH
ncbi:murein biosynthesis integral membrane protein MurJ [Acaryochloris marina]|uniref:Virulence factor MviN, putative n=1 Tax=Acaryochloris marina (strain MBIC 11017) TaxID=329726 RepID=B0C3G9_ACAM1|nr:lipid II flippase MurJ [Acaryochloris marina]ABW29803.1 virulence factor MviN, putative [Acaryochloris marina MBIC11017]BDM78688.1 putative lipid II flippase MurJ [Acaryochloris marina MBIC10699]